MHTFQIPTKPHLPNRILSTVAVTLLTGVAMAFVVFQQPPTLTGEALFAPAPTLGPKAPVAYVDASLPVASGVFATSPADDDEPYLTF